MSIRKLVKRTAGLFLVAGVAVSLTSCKLHFTLPEITEQNITEYLSDNPLLSDLCEELAEEIAEVDLSKEVDVSVLAEDVRDTGKAIEEQTGLEFRQAELEPELEQ